jgi:hypothetical protein
MNIGPDLFVKEIGREREREVRVRKVEKSIDLYKKGYEIVILILD